MSAAPGPPSIRTDWLADLAWRLAAFGLDEWRQLSHEHFVITDVIDGETWWLKASSWEDEPLADAVFEFDGDLYQPGEEYGHGALRLGGSVAAVFDEEYGGRAVRVRLEIGPRGPVTFDPENWIYTFPLAQLGEGERPAIDGVESGAIEPRLPDDYFGGKAIAGKPADVAAAGAVWLGDLVEIAEGRRTWRTVIAVADQVWARRRFGLGPKTLAQPYATLVIEADGELEVAPGSTLVSRDFGEVQPASSIEIGVDRVVIELADDAAPGAPIAITAAGLRAKVERIARD